MAENLQTEFKATHNLLFVHELNDQMDIWDI